MNLNRFCYLLLALAAAASLMTLSPINSWLLLVNGLTFIIYGADKLAARLSWRRVPEITLLLYGLLGGWLGAILGQQIFRHKTQKQPFKTWFYLSVVANLAVSLGVGYMVYRGQVW